MMVAKVAPKEPSRRRSPGRTSKPNQAIAGNHSHFAPHGMVLLKESPRQGCRATLTSMQSTVRTHNIDSKGVDTRLRGGVVALGASLALLVLLVRWQVPWGYSFLAIPPLYGAFLLTFQAGFRVCAMRGMQGTRDVGYGEEKVACPHERRLLRGRALMIHLLAAGLATFIAVGFVSLARL